MSFAFSTSAFYLQHQSNINSKITSSRLYVTIIRLHILFNLTLPLNSWIPNFNSHFLTQHSRFNMRLTFLYVYVLPFASASIVQRNFDTYVNYTLTSYNTSMIATSACELIDIFYYMHLITLC